MISTACKQWNVFLSHVLPLDIPNILVHLISLLQSANITQQHNNSDEIFGNTNHKKYIINNANNQ